MPAPLSGTALWYIVARFSRNPITLINSCYSFGDGEGIYLVVCLLVYQVFSVLSDTKD